MAANKLDKQPAKENIKKLKSLHFTMLNLNKFDKQPVMKNVKKIGNFTFSILMSNMQPFP